MGLGMHVMAYWAGWRLSTGNQSVARLIVDADARALLWLMAWRFADIVGSVAAVITMGAAAELALSRLRMRRFRPGPSDRYSPPHD
jgi:hypothetical protein